MSYDFETLINLEDYHRRMANMYNDIWLSVGDENYVMCQQHLTILKKIRKEIENRVDF